MRDMTLENFTAALASNQPAPGGGGASAAVAALGTALGSMVGNFTTGKKKYAEFEADIQRILAECADLQDKLLDCIARDALAFEPLSRAYAMDKDTPGYAETMEKCLRDAASVPMDILRLSCRAIELHAELLEKGSVMMLSDVGTGVVFCWSALYGAALNVRVNTKLMKDAAYAAALNAEVREKLDTYWKIADEVYEKVYRRFDREN
ncbi:MAG: cyclodeaminase/cyclohydrolase family protein [Oscillospiraceae bacterium]|nr:cyclodeaminase/cyclohydrolase family protein [Oscillospiraceae bacterium]